MHLYVTHFVLRRLRDNRNLSQDQLGEKLGHKPGRARQSKISNWETGKNRIPEKEERNIYSKLGCFPEEIGEALYDVAREEFGFDSGQNRPLRRLRQVEDLLEQHADRLPADKYRDFEERLHQLQAFELEVRRGTSALERAIRGKIQGDPAEPKEG